jgi:RNA polymerase sigma factor (sigma-70 family)
MLRPRCDRACCSQPASAVTGRLEQILELIAVEELVARRAGPFRRNLFVGPMLFTYAMAAQRSVEAIECTYREHGGQLWRGIYAYSGGRKDIADDAVAEAFARALEHSSRIRSLLPWLYRVAFRHAAGRIRDEQRQQELDVVPESDKAANDAPNASLNALALLTPRQRAVVFLFYYADLSIADTAHATGMSGVAVRVQLHRAREALRRRYGSAAAMRAWSSKGGTDERQLV